jgi:hypothetical protein
MDCDTSRNEQSGGVFADENQLQYLSGLNSVGLKAGSRAQNTAAGSLLFV